VPGKVFVEESVPLFYAPNDPEATGTCDFCHISEDGKVVTVRDLKAGAGVLVQAEENTQMAIYAMSFLQAVDQVFTGETTVVMEIDQPRGYGGDNPVSQWVVSAKELNEFCKPINSAVVLIETDIVEFAPSEKACRWCRGKAAKVGDKMVVCPALVETVEMIPVAPTTEGLTPVAPEARAFTIPELVSFFKNRKVIETFLDQVEETLDEMIRKGEIGETQGVKLVEGRKGNRQWVDSDKVERLLARAGIKEKERFKFTLKSPTEVGKLPQVKDDEKLATKVEKLITRSPGQPKLALADDPRPSINLMEGLVPVLELEDILG